MDARLRRATAEDIDTIFRIKRQLMIAPGAGQSALSRGGFLLGSSAEKYAYFIEHANVLILEGDGRALGFSVTLPDALLRTSDLWQRREHINFDEALGSSPEDASLVSEILSGRIGYFEQLALLPIASIKLYAPAFALAAALDLKDNGHRHIFATVVSGPIANLAPLGFLRIIGARRLGRIAEEYPQVGCITSDIYHLDTARWNYDVGPDSPLYAMRQRIARILQRLREPPRLR